ncbi:MAG: hypothetical protein ABI967_16930 [bacterium]
MDFAVFRYILSRVATPAMVNRESQNASDESAPATARPDVIVEFLFEDGLFFISVNNIGERPALNVSVKFNQKITGLGGSRDFGELALFKNIEFLGPGREITTFLDRSSSYFARKEPTRILARVTYSDFEKQGYERTIKHDLEIYRDLAFAAPVASAGENI